MPTDPKDVHALRRKAEKLLREAPEKRAPTPGMGAQQLIHELLVHQTELEMQNEELRRSQEQLEESRDQYADLYDFAPVGYLTLDPKGLVTRANLTACAFLGVERSRLVRMSFAFFVHPESQDLFYLHKQEVLKTATTQTCQLVLITKDVTFFDAQLASIAAQVNGATAIRTVLTDITERKQSEEALHESEQHYRTLFNAIDEGFCIIEVIFDENEKPIDYRFLEINAAFEKQTGLIDAQGKRMRELVPKHEEQWFEIYGRIALTGQPARLESRAEQLHRWYDVYAFRHGRPKDRQVAILFRDISDRRKTEKELETAHQELERRVKERTTELQTTMEALREARDLLERRVGERTAELSHACEALQHEMEERKKTEEQLRQAQKMEALGTLAGGIAHDFNNVLAAIIGFTELVNDHIAEGSPEARHSAMVLKAAIRGRDLVKQMLLFSRRTEEQKRPLRLSRIVKETTKLLRASLPATISIRVSVKSESGLILGDLVQIEQVLMNLATNATHAMREKGGILDVELSDFSVGPSGGNPHGIEPGLYMRLVVTDTGTGIPSDLVEKIFDPFFTTKPVGEGTGLGLAVVLGIVKQSHGYITVETEPGKGTTPSPSISQRLARSRSPNQQSTRRELATGRERILLVDR